MNIIIEGPDSSGKSTLLRIIAQHVPLTIQSGEGPEKYPGEIVERANRYLKMDNTIFDRHPVISQPIYGRFREGDTCIPHSYIDRFYSTQPLIIYCKGLAGAHEIKDYDRPEHLKMINDNDADIRRAYDEWYQDHSIIRYTRQPLELDELIQTCKEFCT